MSDLTMRLRGNACFCSDGRAAADEIERLEARVAELERENAHLASRYDAVCRAESEHCKDCCCARSWAALGISEYTGKSIPEHIEELRRDAARYRHWRNLSGPVPACFTCLCGDDLDAAIDAAMAKEKQP